MISQQIYSSPTTRMNHQVISFDLQVSDKIRQVYCLGIRRVGHHSHPLEAIRSKMETVTNRPNSVAFHQSTIRKQLLIRLQTVPLRQLNSLAKSKIYFRNEFPV